MLNGKEQSEQRSIFVSLSKPSKITVLVYVDCTVRCGEGMPVNQAPRRCPLRNGIKADQITPTNIKPHLLRKGVCWG